MNAPAGSIPRRRFLEAAAIAPLALAGCSRRLDEARALRVATPWPASVRERLDHDFANSLGDFRVPGEPGYLPIVWIGVPEGEPLHRWFHHNPQAADVMLGGSVDDYARLAAEGRLEGLADGAPRPCWRELVRVKLGLLRRFSPDLRPALGDPRVDPMARAWCLGQLPDWSAGYARLVNAHGLATVAPGWRSGSARAAFDQGRANAAVMEIDPDANLEIMGEPIPFVEAAAMRRGSPNAALAGDFLNLLAEQWSAKDGPAIEGGHAAAVVEADARDLAVDLLGATLIDAMDELRIASAAVRKAGSPAWAVELLSTVPPWPPASVQMLLAKEGASGLELLETLIGQVAPGPGLRVWLTQDWLKAGGPIDGPTLAAIAGAEDGSLAREPRFRAWLRAEWTQWARQRYRWVARLAAAGTPPPSVGSTRSRVL